MMVLIPLNAKNIAKPHIIIATVNKGMYSGFSLLERARCKSVGPKNIHPKEIPIVFNPFARIFLSVLLSSIIVILNS